MTSRRLDGFGQHNALNTGRKQHFYELLRIDLVVTTQVKILPQPYYHYCLMYLSLQLAIYIVEVNRSPHLAFNSGPAKQWNLDTAANALSLKLPGGFQSAGDGTTT